MLQQLDTAIGFVVVMLMLSLLVTAMVQAVSALLDLRGKNLVRSLANLFQQIDPALAAHAETSDPWARIKRRFFHPLTSTSLATQLADLVTTHPVLAHSWTRAKAIRKEELLNVLADLRTRIASAAKPADAATQTDSWLKAVQSIDGKIAATLAKAGALNDGVGKWFDTVMDRASDIFTRWTRTITVAISVLLVIALHLDAGSIFRQIATNPDVRAGLNKFSDTALAEAAQVMNGGNRGSNAIKDFAALNSGQVDAEVLKGLKDMQNCADAAAWLGNNVKDKSKAKQLQEQFSDACHADAVKHLEASEMEIRKLRDQLQQTDIQFVPAGVFGDPQASPGQRLSAWYRLYASSPRHLLGVLAMVVLLSLGAPFWFNALKQLSNLKPAIGQKIAQESAATK